MKLLLLLFLCLGISTANAYQLLRLYTFTPAQQKNIVRVHNELRRLEGASNMQEMVWDEGLAKLARDHVATCNAWHRDANQRRGYGYKYIGENIWWSTETWLRYSLTGIVNDLYNEKPFYNYYNGLCQRGEQCGHYTQVVWAKTCAVGCAAAYCDGIQYGNGINHGHIYLCNYGPGGNGLRQYPFKVGQACADCPGSCNNGLCAPQCVSTQHPRGRWDTTRSHRPFGNSVRPQPKPKAKAVKRFDVAKRRDDQVCWDDNDGCDTWRQEGECEKNPLYMQQYCRLACGVCSSKARAAPQTNTDANTDCFDADLLCPFWASINECTSNPGYMMRECSTSCKPDICKGRDSRAKNRACTDEHAECGYWASVGECEKNPGYMHWKCRQVCGLC